MMYNFPKQLQDCLSGKGNKANEIFSLLGNIISELKQNTLGHHWMKAEEDYPVHHFIREINKGSLN